MSDLPLDDFSLLQKVAYGNFEIARSYVERPGGFALALFLRARW